MDTFNGNQKKTQYNKTIIHTVKGGKKKEMTYNNPLTCLPLHNWPRPRIRADIAATLSASIA